MHDYGFANPKMVSRLRRFDSWADPETSQVGNFIFFWISGSRSALNQHQRNYFLLFFVFICFVIYFVGDLFQSFLLDCLTDRDSIKIQEHICGRHEDLFADKLLVRPISPRVWSRTPSLSSPFDTNYQYWCDSRNIVPKTIPRAASTPFNCYTK